MRVCVLADYEPSDRVASFPSGAYYVGEWSPSSPVGRFLGEMNREAVRCGATATNFVSPHGMGCPENLTCATDMLAIMHATMQYPVFRTIVTTKSFVGTGHKRYSDSSTRRGVRPLVHASKQARMLIPCCCMHSLLTYCRRFGRDDVVAKLRWTNTNGLLESTGDLYDGVKTGWVPDTHGQPVFACLASSVRNPKLSDRRLYVVVLGSASKPLRFVDTQQLVSWAWTLPTMRKPICSQEKTRLAHLASTMGVYVDEV